MSIDKLVVDVKCSEAFEYTMNLYSCNYKGDCVQKMDFGGGKYCRYELRKGIIKEVV